MGTTDVLRSSIQSTHDSMTERLEAARGNGAPADGPRQGYARIDAFCAVASQHMHAVDAVLVPVARKQCPDGSDIVHGYLHAVREFEVVLAHVKAHEYGSVYESSFEWPAVWSDVSEAMALHVEREQALGETLTETLDDEGLVELTERLRAAERAAPTRPHPYTPHTGLLGLIARRVMHTADTFWDTVEGRMVPEPARRPKKPPGRVAQYFLADPRFDPEASPTQERESRPD